jgi:hypothetical protein
MPTRYLKESICTSDTLTQLSWLEEVMFYRLIVTVDDFGRYDARPAVLRARLFPLKDVTLTAIDKALHAMVTAGLVSLYSVDGKPILQLLSWGKHQNIRAKSSKYPGPEEADAPTDTQQSSAYKCMQAPADSSGIEIGIDNRKSESESKSRDTRTGARSPSPKGSRIDVDAVLEVFNEVARDLPRARMTSKRASAIRARAEEGYKPEDFRTAFLHIQEDDFYSGRNGKWTGCNIDWILGPENFVKALELVPRKDAGKRPPGAREYGEDEYGQDPMSLL